MTTPRPALRPVGEVIRLSLDLTTRLSIDKRLIGIAESIGDLLVETLGSGGRAFFCGNGGSAADAQHFAAELSGHYLFDRPPLAAEVLHGNPSHLTAVANDYAYDVAFARALEASSRPGDALVAISTSGNSPSVVRAAEAARRIGVRVVAMTGADGGVLAQHAELLLNVPSSETGRIQEAHVIFIHAISERVEHLLFPG